MSEIDPQIDELQKRLDALVKTQIGFQSEISAIRNELARLAQPKRPAPRDSSPIHDTPSSATEPLPPQAPVTQRLPPATGQPTYSSSEGSYRSDARPPRSRKPEPSPSSTYVAAARSNLEEFIGKNLISLIGVIILMLGVGIGVKFAIDKGLISPALRVAIAYGVGVVLIVAAIRLKAKYLNFSAVLISGGAAILYFVTYYAYAAYFLIPQPLAFVLMAIFTALTVAAAIIYNRQVIAHIGLVGAYAVPFLLSDGSGNYFFLFVYMTIINAGILAISVTRFWRVLYYTSFLFTWLIFGTWLFSKYDASEHLVLAVIFSTIFFAIFYAVSFVYRLWFSQTGMIENAGLVFTNSFVFYGFGYAIVNSREDLRPFLGLFTAAHGILHALLAHLVNRFKPNAIDVVQVLAVLIITFTTIAVPVQLDGNHVTLVWAAEAAALFYFGRARGVRLFEYFSYPLMFLATGSLLVDWITSYAQRTSYVSEWNLRPFLNGDFVTAIVFVAAFAFIYFINSRKDYVSAISDAIVRPVGMIIGAVALFVLYNTFRVEISNYHNLLASRAYISTLTNDGTIWDSLTDYDIERFDVLWQLNYTMFFLSVLAIFNVRRIRSEVVAYGNVAFGVFVLFIFLTVGMNYLYELRLTYMNPEAARTLGSGPMNIAIRYISYVFAAGLLFSLFQYCRGEVLDSQILRTRRILFFEAIIYPTIFIAASCELSNLMAQFYIADASKLGLSILWGVYALCLIVLGIAWSKKHLRIAAMVIFGVTLVKLFFYDISDLPTIPKTILFVSLGLLLLLVSFLYNKYKNVIFPAVAEEGK